MASGGTAWQEARHSARQARHVHEAAGENADTLLRAALDAADLRAVFLPPRDPLLSHAHAVLDTEAETIWVRDDVSLADRNVLVAHELGHLFLHEHGTACRCSHADVTTLPESTLAVGYGPRQRRETEANVWAREFLLPVPLAHRLFYDEMLDAHALAARIGVPLGLVFAQLMEVAAPKTAETAESVPPAAPVGLDASQKAAATWEEPAPLLVGAGPGTGKTRTLTARVLFLTREKNVAPENILALTFSRKAAEEMRERIAAHAPDVARRAAISTFHAYGLDLLRRYSHAARLPSSPILLEAVDACALLERRIGALGLSALRYLHDPAFPLPDILRVIGRAKEDLIAPDEFAARALASGDEKLQETARVYAAYEILLQEKGALDFADLICRALRLLQNSEVVRRAEQTQWQHILVDEYQDVNRAGSLLVQTLASGGNGAAHLWAVGDIRQAIYAFRGASPANVSRFASDFVGGQRVPLAVNYRSRPQLTALFGVACGEGEKTWQASREPAQTTVTLAVAPDEIAQADNLAREIRTFETCGYGLGAQVALCRTRRQAAQLRQSLRERGIPIAPGPDEGGLLWQSDVKKLLLVLSRACEENSPARARYPVLPAGLPVKGAAFEFWTELLWGKLGWARDISDRASVAQLLALARVFGERAEIVLESREEPRAAFLNHLRRMARLGTSFGERAEAEGNTETVRVLTVHAAKGLEFPVVFVPNLSAGKFPSRAAPSLLSPLPGGASETAAEDSAAEDSANDEEARLFFVAVTRARDHLVLSRAEKYHKISAKPSPLLACLDGVDTVKRVAWESLPPCPPIMGGSDLPFMINGSGSFIRASSEPPIIGGQGGQEHPPEVEAWQAELYLRCPRRYAYACVENLPTGPTTPYADFKQAVQAAQQAANPGEALAASWKQYGPDDTHPLASLYRNAAHEIVALPAPLPATQESVPALHVERPDGTLLVRPARSVAADNAVVETQTFRRPPKPGAASVPAETRQSLLMEAVSQANPTTEPVVHLRYLQTGQVFPVVSTPKKRAAHLARYDKALQGISLKVFPPTPESPEECPVCPYLFLCPE